MNPYEQSKASEVGGQAWGPPLLHGVVARSLCLALSLSISAPVVAADMAAEAVQVPVPMAEVAPAPAVDPVGSVEVAPEKNVEEKLGVHIKGVRLSAGGFMLDVRYRVLDAEKAAPLLNRKIHLYLEASNGARLGVPASPKIGPLRSTSRGVIRPDRDYTVLFGNPGGYLKPGSKVSLVVGDKRIDNLTVQ